MIFEQFCNVTTLQIVISVFYFLFLITAFIVYAVSVSVLVVTCLTPSKESILNSLSYFILVSKMTFFLLIYSTSIITLTSSKPVSVSFRYPERYLAIGIPHGDWGTVKCQILSSNGWWEVNSSRRGTPKVTVGEFNAIGCPSGTHETNSSTHLPERTGISFYCLLTAQVTENKRNVDKNVKLHKKLETTTDILVTCPVDICTILQQSRKHYFEILPVSDRPKEHFGRIVLRLSLMCGMLTLLSILWKYSSLL